MTIKYEFAPLIILETASLILLAMAVESKSVKLWCIAFGLFVGGLVACLGLRFIRIKLRGLKWKK